MKRPAPQFRPRREKQRPLRERRWFFAAVAAGVLVLGVVGVVLGLTLSGGDSDGASGTPTPIPISTGGTRGGRDAVIQGPASRYTLLIGPDVKTGYKADLSRTYRMSSTGFATNGYFASATDGQAQADAWGYQDGYQTYLEPDGQLAGVLQGRFYIRTEAYLFDTVDGARKAFAYIVQSNGTQKGSERETPVDLANESAGFKFLDAPIASSDVIGVYHRFLFRRGNLVVVVQTYGADNYMTIDAARELAIVLDNKALGDRVSPTPTPAPVSTLQTAPPASATP